MFFEDLANYYSNSYISTITYYVVNDQSKEIYYIKKKTLIVIYIIDTSQEATY